MSENAYQRESREVRAFLEHVTDNARVGERTLAERTGQVLDAFAERLKAAGVPPSSVLPARYAMAVLIDNIVRDLPSVRTSAWLAAAHVHVFDRREITFDRLRQFADTARTQGPDYDDFAAFLSGIIDELDGKRRTRRGVSRTPGLVFGLAFMAYLGSLAAYAAWKDYRYHADLLTAFNTELASLPEAHSPERLASIAELHGEVTRASDNAPLSRLVTLPFWVSGPQADAVYRAEVAATLPDLLREAIGEALASEGDNADLYDILRAWTILTGRTDWSPAYLEGWIEARADRLGLDGLVRHVAYLDGPEPRLANPDEELMDQARQLATGATEAERAYLELVRLPEMRALGRWRPTEHIAEIETVFVLRSGRPLDEGVPRIFATEGWDMAKGGAVDAAIRTARIEAARLFPEPAATSFDTRSEVLDRLQTATLDTWKDWLEDLRVRPFTDGKSAILVSGALSRQNSPLDRVIEEVWQAAGGDDPTRPVANRNKVEAAFGPAISYLRSGEISSLSGLFATLNVALSTMDVDETRGIDALMNLQERARSAAALNEAPPLVAQIAEDVLAQTSAAHARVLTNPLTREWQARVYPVCQRAIDGRYPFHRGSDADLGSFEDFFGARGALLRFFNQYADRNLDTTGDRWRWSSEARLSGVTPESAEFLQRAIAAAQVFYGENRAFGTEFEIAPLAERGDAEVQLGGETAAMSAKGHALSWPGAEPERGMTVSFSENGSVSRIEEPGLWGFLRLMDQTSVRNRDEGRRQLVDLRTGGGRLFFELSFETPLNPIAARALLQGITCPPVL